MTMKVRVIVTLPEAVYEHYRAEAAHAQMVPEEYLSRVLAGLAYKVQEDNQQENR